MRKNIVFVFGLVIGIALGVGLSMFKDEPILPSKAQEQEIVIEKIRSLVDSDGFSESIKKKYGMEVKDLSVDYMRAWRLMQVQLISDIIRDYDQPE